MYFHARIRTCVHCVRTYTCTASFLWQPVCTQRTRLRTHYIRTCSCMLLYAHCHARRTTHLFRVWASFRACKYAHNRKVLMSVARIMSVGITGLQVVHPAAGRHQHQTSSSESLACSCQRTRCRVPVLSRRRFLQGRKGCLVYPARLQCSRSSAFEAAGADSTTLAFYCQLPRYRCAAR
jgi:hypothetical protein